MHIKMKIIEVWPSEHSVVVRYFTDKVTEEMLAQHDGTGDIPRRPDGSPVRCRTDVNINIDVIPAPTGQALIDYINKKNVPPHAWLDLQEKIADPAVDTAMQGIEQMVGQVADAPLPPAPTPPVSRGAVELRARRDPAKKIGTTIL